MKTGRNDPCPCGSGKKYKQCCLRNEPATPAEPPLRSALRKAEAFLQARFRSRQREILSDEFFDVIEPEDLAKAVDGLDAGHRAMLFAQVDDWMLCEARYERHGDSRRGIEWVLADPQVRLTPPERVHLEALAAAPLRLYEVAMVEPGRGLLLRDLCDAGKRSCFVHEVAASHQADDGDVFGVRIVDGIDGTLRLSSVVYTFPRIEAMDVLEEIRDTLDVGDDMPVPAIAAELDNELIAEIIRERWLVAVLDPPELPELVTPDGEPLRLIEDTYDVRDADALRAAMDAQLDVESDGEQGWTRVPRSGEDADAMRSVFGSIYPGEVPGTMVLFHRSLTSAELGRGWFERIAGDAVRHRGRETTEPGDMASATRSDRGQSMSYDASGLPPEVHSAAIERALHTIYADWCDTPLPAFEDRAPRALLATRDGRERVRFMLRTYELGERDMAKAQSRPAVAFDFLWERLGLAREEGSAE